VGTIPPQTKEDLLEGIPSKDGIVLELVVEADYRKKGVGTMLMNKLEEYFRQNKCDASRVGVFLPNIKARRLYKKLGYRDRDVYMIKKLRNR
jgi:ribosomal protein S18 acetylase RimI-like enzyme